MQGLEINQISKSNFIMRLQILILFRIPNLQTCMFNDNLHFVTQFEKQTPLAFHFLNQKIVNVFDQKKKVSTELHALGRHSSGSEISTPTAGNNTYFSFEF